jgi:vacuolar protein sorting-associated protein 52
MYREANFTTEFFNLLPTQYHKIFSGIFQPTITFFQDYIKTLTSNSNDVIGLLLTILINEINKKNYADKKLESLDFYFDQVNIIIWPRFEKLFETHLQSIKNINPKNFRNLEK